MNLRRIIGAFLCFSMLFALLAETAVGAEDIYAPGEVAKVFITTSRMASLEYADCTVRIIDAEGGQYDEIYDSKATFRIRGNSTSSGAKKPYNIKFSSKTDVLGMGKNKKWCLLANCYDKTLIRNQMVLDFAYQTGLRYTPEYRVAEVYFNGRFQGCYLLIDAIKASSSRVDIDTDGNEFILERDARTDEGTTYFTTSRYGIRLGINEPEEQTPEQYRWLMNFMTEAENAIASGDFKQVEKYFDIDSMIDFYIVLEYFKNVDIDVGSTRFYIKDGKMYGGPCWDFDLSSGNCDYDYYWDYNNRNTTGDSTEGLWCNQLWYRYLLRYDEFLSAVKARYMELQDLIVNLYADDRLGVNYLDRTLATYGNVFDRNYKVADWSVYVKYSTLEKTPAGSYAREISYLREWLRRRNEWLLKNWGLKSELTARGGTGYSVDGYFIHGVPEKTTYSQLKKLFSDSGVYGVAPNGAKAGDDALVCNGSAMTRGGVNYTVILRGDPIADGKITIVDYVYVKRYLLGTISGDAIQAAAADVSGNGSVDTVDYIMIKRHVLGTYTITP